MASDAGNARSKPHIIGALSGLAHVVPLLNYVTMEPRAEPIPVNEKL